MLLSRLSSAVLRWSSAVNLNSAKTHEITDPALNPRLRGRGDRIASATHIYPDAEKSAAGNSIGARLDDRESWCDRAR